MIFAALFIISACSNDSDNGSKLGTVNIDYESTDVIPKVDRVVILNKESSATDYTSQEFTSNGDGFVDISFTLPVGEVHSIGIELYATLGNAEYLVAKSGLDTTVCPYVTLNKVEQENSVSLVACAVPASELGDFEEAIINLAWSFTGYQPALWCDTLAIQTTTGEASVDNRFSKIALYFEDQSAEGATTKTFAYRVYLLKSTVSNEEEALYSYADLENITDQGGGRYTWSGSGATDPDTAQVTWANAGTADAALTLTSGTEDASTGERRQVFTGSDCVGIKANADIGLPST